MDRIKNVAKVLFVALVLIFMVVFGSASAVYYENWEKNMSEDGSKFAQFLTGNTTNKEDEAKKLEPNFTCLFMGRNAHLTDFIMLGQYNPNTREVSLMSIPRDTYVGNASVDGKINSIYMNKYPEKVVAEVEEITGVEIQHYLVFDAKMLRKIIDKIGGVTVDVPINMDYDDPEQDLYIHLRKGTQKLTGDQAEQFVRFRKNNDGTGYPNGDIGRIAAQQQFIKAVAAELLKAENVSKMDELVTIVLGGTKTDITAETIGMYIGDVLTFKTDRMRIETLPGNGKYDKGPDGLTRSYYFHDEVDAATLIDDLFFGVTATQNGDAVEGSGENQLQEVGSSDLIIDSTEKMRVEVLNAKATTSVVNNLVEELNEKGCNVVKIGNYITTDIESSRIITYGTHTEDELKKIKELTGINKVEESTKTSTVKFSVIIGPSYK